MVTRGSKMHVVAECDECGKRIPIFHGWLSRLVLKSHIDALVSAEQHECKPQPLIRDQVIQA